MTLVALDTIIVLAYLLTHSIMRADSLLRLWPSLTYLLKIKNSEIHKTSLHLFRKVGVEVGVEFNAPPDTI